MGSTVISRKSIIFYIRTYTEGGQNSSVGRATRYELEDTWIEFWRWGGGGSEIFRTRTNRPWIPSSLLDNRHWVSFPGAKRPGRGADQHPHLAPRLKKELYLYYPSGPSWPFITTKSQEHQWPIGQFLLHHGKVKFLFMFSIIILLPIPVAARLLGLWVWIPSGHGCPPVVKYCVLSGRGLCVGIITRPEESYRLWCRCVVVCDLETWSIKWPWPALGCSLTVLGSC